MLSRQPEFVAKPHRDSFTREMQFEFMLGPRALSASEEFLAVAGRQIRMALVKNPRARRYILRLRPNGVARVTIPRGGSITEARRFAERNQAWLERQVSRLATHPVRPQEWLIGTEILLRGELVRIEAGATGESGLIRFGGETLRTVSCASNLRRPIERYLWRLAAEELPPRVLEFAATHQLQVRRITVRNQKSRWGSCSPRGTISLNWRLVQAPAFVRDYIIVHELMHLRQMNHSARFWREVDSAFPGYQAAERWLKRNSSVLR
jgi:predicted metal-dependent hydrolase